MSNAPIIITIGGPPTAKGRPRFTRKGFTYTPAATRKYEAHGRLAAQEAMNGHPPIAVPVRAEIIADLPVPGSWSPKRRDAALRGDIRSTSRPDTDNYVKAGLDAINAIVVTDDSLVVELVAAKRYASVPALTITVTTAKVATVRAPSSTPSPGFLTIIVAPHRSRHSSPHNRTSTQPTSPACAARA